MDKDQWKHIMDAEFAKMKELADRVRMLMKNTNPEVREQAALLQEEWNRSAARHREAFSRYFNLDQ